MKKDLNKILIEKKKNKVSEYKLWVDMFKATMNEFIERGCAETNDTPFKVISCFLVKGFFIGRLRQFV